MSHFTRVATKITSIPALVQATQALGLSCTVALGGTRLPVRGYQGQKEQADVVISCGNYDLGFVRQGDAYEVVTDWWGIGSYGNRERLPAALRAEVDRGASGPDIIAPLLQRYAYEHITATLAGQGYSLGEPATNDRGELELLATDWR